MAVSTPETNDRAEDARRLRVILADDDPLVRRVLREALQDAGLTVIAEAATGRETVELALHYRPDVLVVDLVMPDGDGLQAIRRIKTAGVTDILMVVLTSSANDDEAVAALRAGAVGFLTKDVALDGLGRVLQGVMEGEAAVSRRLSRVVIDRLRSAPESRVGLRPVRSRLSPREWEVLDMMCEEKSTDEMADILVLSVETVRSHIKHILSKLDVRSREAAVALAAELRAPNGP